jgi:hypothetical protein
MIPSADSLPRRERVGVRGRAALAIEGMGARIRVERVCRPSFPTSSPLAGEDTGGGCISTGPPIPPSPARGEGEQSLTEQVLTA